MQLAANIRTRSFHLSANLYIWFAVRWILPLTVTLAKKGHCEGGFIHL